jgi:SAM-dependent methyltransferase
LNISNLPEHDVGLDWLYTMQHQIALRWFLDVYFNNIEFFDFIEKASGAACLDIGSSLNFVSIMASLTRFVHVDPNLNMAQEKKISWAQEDTRLGFWPAEAQDLPFPDGTCTFVSSLHAIEHFGLGRYGDTIDPTGDKKAINEINRVLNEDGIFIGAVPIDVKKRERIIFNKNRIYSIETIKLMLEKNNFLIVNDHCIIPPMADMIDLEGNDVNCILDVEDFDKIMKICDWKQIPPDAIYIWLAKKIK